MVKHKAPLSALALSATLLASGCASIVSDSQWPVSLNSTPSGAEYTVRNEDGAVVASGHTPNTVILPSGAGFFDGETYLVEFNKDGFVTGRATVDSKLNGWYWGNLIFGGLVGLFLVDPATGAMWKLPTTTHAQLKPHASAASDYDDYVPEFYHAAGD